MTARLVKCGFRTYVWLALLVGVAGLLSCSRDGQSDRRKLLDGLPDEMIHHLISSDDSTFTEYGRQAGFVVLSDASRQINRRMRRAYVEGRDEEGAILLEFNKRIGHVVAHDYNYPLYLNQLEFIDGFPLDVRRRAVKLERDFYAFRSDIDRPVSEKIATYTRMLDEFEELGDVLYMGITEYELSLVHKALGNDKEEIDYLHTANTHFAECGLHEMTIGTLGELGAYCEKSGDVDSMIVCYEKAKRIAHESRLPLEAAFITSLYASHYARGGHLSLAYELFTEAMETCRKYKGQYLELGYIVDTMIFQASLNCWDIVERLIARARVLQSAHAGNPREYFKLHSIQIDGVEGRMMMARGKVADAEVLFHKAREALEVLDLPDTREPETALLYTGWSQGLLDNGRDKEALDVGRRGLYLSLEADLTKDAARCAVLVAEAALELNDLQTVGWAIQMFDSLAGGDGLQREWIKRDAILGAVELEKGNRQAARGALETGLGRLKQFVSGRDASTQSYLWIGECGALRQLMHDLTSHEPALGYGAELLWQGMYRSLGRGTAASALKEGVTIAETGKRAEAVRQRLTQLDAIHCLYVIRGEEIWRWTVSSDGIHRDILEVSSSDMRKLVDETWRMMAPDPARSDARMSPRLGENLRTLARVMLPPVVRHASAPTEGPFLVTADGFLGRIPFEAFDVGKEDRYTPLLLHRDVAYLRYADEADTAANTAPGVILASDKPSKELRNRYPFARELPEALAEAQAIAALRQRDKLLTGASATKSNLQSLWQDAPFVYLAAHTLRDPQVPYLMLIPLGAPTAPSAPEAHYLDFHDVRTASFARCQLVVLSGCSSGAPYVEANNVGPSLGDAFLDAGAGAVIQTFWDVRDDHARQLMTSFIASWEDPAVSRIHALCQARRKVLRDTEDAEHLSRWAAFAIKIGRI